MKVVICDHFLNRFLGFMFQKRKECAYFFPSCNSIHTFFCFFPLDILLLDKNKNVIDKKLNIKPWRVYFFKCDSIVEIPSGFLSEEKEKEILSLIS